MGMGINHYAGSRYTYKNTASMEKNSQSACTQTKKFSDAVTEVEREGEEEFLGITMIPEEGQSTVYGMRAMLSTEFYQKFLEEKINELFVKIQNEDTEPSYQIGEQSFTEKEWEEFLEKFDSIEEIIKELMRERHKKIKEKQKEQKEVQKKIEETKDSLEVQKKIEETKDILFAESTTCTYPTSNPNDEDMHYITWYTEEGIFCRKTEQMLGYEWRITFEKKEQYEKVIDFIEQFPSNWNMRFAAHENFWTDFLNNEIDINGFMEFMEGTNKGVPDFSLTVGDSMYIDKEKMQWAEYLNPLGSRFYTADEMQQKQEINGG